MTHAASLISDLTYLPVCLYVRSPEDFVRARSMTSRQDTL